ncbi:hypothetical protein TWF696_001227 [Orbilia brochopaga]|uniref:Rhodopsin domain-containing protein n=1 Tax=Orbilia brochopaga TaxID=3140254 RepID=A0AAV9UC22_9PEZI
MYVHPGHIPNDNKEILTAPLVLLALSIIFVGLRLWTRAKMVKFLGPDDWWILGALASDIAGTMLSVAGTFKGEGNHIYDLEDNELIYVLKASNYLLYAEVILQPVTLNFIKLSILSFYLRLPGTYRFRLLAKITYAFVAAMMLAFVFTLVFACIPISRQWDPYETRGGCINRSLFWHIILGLNVATNLWILVLPMRMLLGLRVERRQKIMVLCIFGVGLVATVASILALVELPLAINDPDKTWGSWRLAVYASVENNFGIIAASAPALKPLIGKTARRVKSSIGSISTTLWSSSSGSGTKGSISTCCVGTTTSNATSSSERQTARPTTNGNPRSSHGFHISEGVKRFMSTRASAIHSSQGSANRSTSHHIALTSHSHGDTAVLDTIGILPVETAFPRHGLGSRNGGRAPRVFTEETDGLAEIHHIRDWRLDQNDYCIDLNAEHNLPQRPQKTYQQRISIDSSHEPSPESVASGRRTSQVESYGSVVSLTDVATDRILEASNEDAAEAAARSRDLGDNNQDGESSSDSVR